MNTSSAALFANSGVSTMFTLVDEENVVSVPKSSPR